MKNRKSPERGRQGGRKRAQKTDIFVLPTPNGLIEISVSDPKSASLVGRYWNAVRSFLDTGDESTLRRFRGKIVRDTAGRTVALLADLDELERLGAAGVLSFESIYARLG